MIDASYIFIVSGTLHRSAVDRDVSVPDSSDLVARWHVGEDMLVGVVAILTHPVMPDHVLDPGDHLASVVFILTLDTPILTP